MRRTVLLGVLLLGCAEKPASDALVLPEPENQPLRVLVTGFNDWKDLGEPPNVWRCRDNPSCRLLVGDSLDAAPHTFEGPLVRALKTAAGDRSVAWSFSTLPVTWGVTTERTDYGAYDVVVHLGLGVYDRKDEVFVEAGAFNHRRGTDVAGRAVDEAIVEGKPSVIEAPPHVAAAVRAVDGRRFGEMRARAMEARDANAYLCNETHTLALEAVRESLAGEGALQAAYFVHIPQPAAEDWTPLADAVAGVVVALALDESTSL
jgi:hypothetical protein